MGSGGNCVYASGYLLTLKVVGRRYVFPPITFRTELNLLQHFTFKKFFFLVKLIRTYSFIKHINGRFVSFQSCLDDLTPFLQQKKKKKYISNSEGSCFYETANNTKDKIIEWELISDFFFRFFSFLKDVHVCSMFKNRMERKHSLKKKR